MTPARPSGKKKQAALLGLAFDGDDDTKRITRGPNFLLAGGSAETHGVMQEVAVKINERLKSSGRELADVTPDQLRDIVADIRR
jgi:hypothetical protein